MKANVDVRNKISSLGLKHWEVADAAGISVSTLCIWFRKPLTGERKKQIEAAITEAHNRKQEELKCANE